MSPIVKPRSQQIVAITGTSSGIELVTPRIAGIDGAAIAEPPRALA